MCMLYCPELKNVREVVPAIVTIYYTNYIRPRVVYY